MGLRRTVSTGVPVRLEAAVDVSLRVASRRSGASRMRPRPASVMLWSARSTATVLSRARCRSARVATASRSKRLPARRCSANFRAVSCAPSPQGFCKRRAAAGMDEKDRRRTSRRSDDRFARRCSSRLRVRPSTSFAASAYAAGRACLREHPPPANSRRGRLRTNERPTGRNAARLLRREGIVI